MELLDKVALITGASSGIGRATALKFAAEGARLGLAGRDRAALEMLQSELGSGCQSVVLSGDLTVQRDAESAVYGILAAFGGMDVLVNSAGILTIGTIETTSLTAWDEMLDINLRSIFHLMQLSLATLIERRGNIVNVSSVTGLRAFPGVLAYCVAKAGLDQLTRCAAIELATKGVRVNAVNPGVVRTNMHLRGGLNEKAYAEFLDRSRTTHNIGRIGRPEEVADLITLPATPRCEENTETTSGNVGGCCQTSFR